MSKKTITIFGTSKAGESDSAYILAYETGRLLAQAGLTVANGGYGGTMLAAAKGASEAGGEVIGVTCTAFKNSRPNKCFLITDKPIILLGGFWKPLVDLIANDDPDSSRYIKLASEPQQVIKLINEC